MDENIELYKKYQPRKWEDMVGQLSVTRSFQSDIKKGKVKSAYGFFGPRGCGKTSTAFLLAKAINCENPQPGSNPCNECDTCVNIDNETQMGVSYISMANKGSVDDIRELVRNAYHRMPVKHQVFILDEVHNLSKAAFDALLVPMDAKKMPAIFIMCSTEVDKIPQTILSRIQPRRFNLVSSDEMIPYLADIAEKEQLEYTDEQVMEAVRQGRGSVRDTLTAFDAIVSTGQSFKPVGGDLLKAVCSADLPSALTAVSSAVSEGHEGRNIAESLFSDLRNLLFTASGVSSGLIGVLPIEDTDGAIRSIVGKRGIITVMREIGDAINRMSMGNDSRILLETALVSAVFKVKKLQKAYQSKS